MLMRSITSFKVSNIQREDAGKYLFSVESQELRQVVVFILSVTGFSITGSAKPPIAQIGQKVTLSCEMKGCTSSKLRMHLYKWESCKNQTLFIHDSTREPNIQENSPEEREKNGSPREQEKNRPFSVILDEVQLANSGQYVCAMVCDDVYKESTMELQVEGSRSSEFFSWVLLFFIIFVLDFIDEIYNFKHKAHKTEQSNCLSLKSTDPLKAENDPLKAENDQLRRENERLTSEKEQAEAAKEQAEAAKEFSDARFYKVDLAFDSKTAHPRLEVSEAGKSVRDTGKVFKVSNNEKRFDSHMFIMSTQGYSKGKYYWEVDVSQIKKWDLGVASESICRKGTITLSPQNEYWVIGLDGGKDYWARTDPWTLLKVTGRPTIIGIFLDMSANQSLSFYDVNTKNKLHTFSIHCSGKMYPFFSVSSGTVQEDNPTLKIVNLEQQVLHEK